MSAHADDSMKDLLRRIARARGNRPLSLKEAQTEYESAIPESLTPAELSRLVRRIAAGKPFHVRKASSASTQSAESAVNEEMLVLNRNAGDLDPESKNLIEELRRQALADAEGEDQDDVKEDGDDRLRPDPG